MCVAIIAIWTIMQMNEGVKLSVSALLLLFRGGCVSSNDVTLKILTSK